MAEKKNVTKPVAAQAAVKTAKPLQTAPVAKKPAIKKHFVGVVVSTKNAKTAIVKVDSIIVHPKYGKRYVRSTHYKVHDEDNASHVGDKVSFIECRPLSRDKRWRIVK
jgi:small subunit ribosomal protein S17